MRSKHWGLPVPIHVCSQSSEKTKIAETESPANPTKPGDQQPAVENLFSRSCDHEQKNQYRDGLRIMSLNPNDLASVTDYRRKPVCHDRHSVHYDHKARDACGQRRPRQSPKNKHIPTKPPARRPEPHDRHGDPTGDSVGQENP
jgi:hypothetical protein